jgi:hypothetical protein
MGLFANSEPGASSYPTTAFERDMENYIILGTIFVALSAVLAVRLQYLSLKGRLRAISKELDQTKRGQIGLIEENFTQAEAIDRLVAIERDFYQLRREHSRATTTIGRLCRMHTGMTLECEKLEQRIAALTAEPVAPEELGTRIAPLREQVVALLDWTRRVSDREVASANRDERMVAVG